MERTRTSDFDVLLQVSEDELNNQIANVFLTDPLFPSIVSRTGEESPVQATTFLNFRTPTVDLTDTRTVIRLIVDFSDSTLIIDEPQEFAGEITALGGTIQIVERIRTAEEDGEISIFLDFTAITDDEIDLDFDTDSIDAFNRQGIPIEQVRSEMRRIIAETLRESIRRMPLSPPVSAEEISEIQVTTINDTEFTDRDCIALGIRMSADSGGDPNAGRINDVRQNFITPAGSALLMISNRFLFAQFRREAADELEIPPDSFAAPFELRSPVTIEDITIRRFTGRVDGNRIRFDGFAEHTTRLADIEATFTFFADFSAEDGDVTISFTRPDVDIEIELPPSAYIVGGLFGFLFPGVGTAIAASILIVLRAGVEFLEILLEQFVNRLSRGSSSGLSSLFGGSLRIDGIELDDLELRCSIIPEDRILAREERSHSSRTGFAVDLDSGTIGPDTFSGADLVWSPIRGISTVDGARLRIVAISYEQLTPERMSRLEFTDRRIPRTDIPIGGEQFVLDLGRIFLGGVVFAVRTSAGRFARVRAWQDDDIDRVHMTWVTYDNPIPLIDLRSQFSVLAKGDQLNPGATLCQKFSVRSRTALHAEPQLMALPIDFVWSLNGEVLTTERGSVTVPSGTLDYTLSAERDRLTVETTEIGQIVDCPLCVTGTDARRQEVVTCTDLRPTPIVFENCKIPDPPRPIPRLRIIPAGPLVATWRPLLPEIAKALAKRPT
ncbi:hypothetical protein [Nocardia sp. NPDC058480]|uniref:hypothetical protein n=1 Tax=unclassified Nocardia TaxID=2637762 RepID=UPI0036557D63